MIASVRDLENKFTFTTSNMSPMQTFVLLTMSFSSNIGMDFFIGPSPDNYNEVRDRPLLTKENISRNLSMFFTKSSIAYYERIKHNNAIVIRRECGQT